MVFYGYAAKSADKVEIGDVVMIAGSPPFTVCKKPEWVEDGMGHVLIEGRTKLGLRASGVVHKWHHKVLYRDEED